MMFNISGDLSKSTQVGGAYYGQRGTYFADVSGDGRADAIVVNDDTTHLRRSNGSSFGAYEDWTGGAF